MGLVPFLKIFCSMRRELPGRMPKAMVPLRLYLGILLLFSNCLVLFYDSPRLKPLFHYEIEVNSPDGKNTFRLELEKEEMDLLELLEEASLKESPSLRFMTTKQSVEVIRVNEWNNTWKEAWFLYLHEERLTGEEIKKGKKIENGSTLSLRYEKVDRLSPKR